MPKQTQPAPLPELIFPADNPTGAGIGCRILLWVEQRIIEAERRAAVDAAVAAKAPETGA